VRWNLFHFSVNTSRVISAWATSNWPLFTRACERRSRQRYNESIREKLACAEHCLPACGAEQTCKALRVV
jgi:hypothetical protein